MPEVKLTESADERRFKTFFAKNAIYHVPLFQRPYRWKPAKVKQFQNDLLATLESEDDLHFMGALIVHRHGGNFRDNEEFEIIDGQQRVTTIFLHIAAAAYVLSTAEGGGPEAWRLLYNYLINNEFNNQSPASLKLHPSRDDREPLNEVMKRVLTSQGIAHSAPAGLTIAYLGKGNAFAESSRIERNFNDAVKFFRDQHRENGNERITDLVETILGQMTVVVIEVVDPLSGPKIFDSLNSGQEPMTVGDLVRNDVFARVSDTGPTLDAVESQHWAPFFLEFGRPSDGHFENFFFPYGLISSPNTKKADVYRLLRERWANENLDSVQVIERLAEYQPDYMMMRLRKPLEQHPAQVREAFRRLMAMGSPSAINPFVMRLSNEVRGGNFDPDECVKIIAVVDSFLTRRATVGQEASGLHSVFKRLWSDAEVEGGVTAHMVLRVISEARAVQFPNDEEFARAIRERRLHNVKITSYLIGELNRSLGGDLTEGDYWIEHVLPQQPDGGWNAFSDEDRRQLTDRLANLLPLSSEMNRSLSNSGYSVKRQRYESDSRFKMARQFANEYEDWTPTELHARADRLVELATARWPFGPALD